MSDSPLSSDEEVLVLCLALKAEEEENEEKEAKRAMWVHDMCAARDEEGEYRTLFPHLKNDNTKFFQYFRMSYEKFCELRSHIEGDITKQDTTFRRSISTEERLAVTLRWVIKVSSMLSAIMNLHVQVTREHPNNT